ncbi:MAG: extracellular solute-binding protein [Lachnospiraceae bacterium]|nr:extracellular solute-binding protein [Lachnospiraceae bacterium]
MTKKVYSILFVLLLLGFMVGAGMLQHTGSDEAAALLSSDQDLIVWYTDEALEGYFTNAALAYREETGITVKPVQVSGLEYLEHIHDVEVTDATEGTNIAPDLYVATNDVLEKAYLSGLAVEVTDPTAVLNDTFFRPAALSAVTYQGKRLGYPLYFETSVFLCNRTYVRDMAEKTIEAEKNIAEGEAAQELADQAETAEEFEALVSDNSMVSENAVDESVILAKEEEVMPKTISEILTFADGYDAPENVEGVFKWDVSDIFYNYFIVGDSISVGGENGDDAGIMNVYNDNSVACLTLYQELNQFFSIDTKAVTYDSVLEEFMEGKTVFTVATTDAIRKLEAAKQDGTFPYEYSVATLPNVSDTLSSRPLSVTNVCVVNGFGDQQDKANDFASFLLQHQDASFYDTTGKIAARGDLTYENPAVLAALTEYGRSIPMPKLMSTSDFWAKLEIAFTKVWTGSDVNEVLTELNNSMQP